MSERDRRDDQLGLFGDGPPAEERHRPSSPESAPDPGSDPGPPPTRESAALERDRSARALAQTELRRPLLVEAGAGTGKTTTLTARILAWSLGPGWERGAARVAEREAAARPLAPPAEPDPEAVAAEVLSRVVAITFTEAAAAEMASRMGQALAGLAGGQEAPPWLLTDGLPPEPERARRARALLGALDHLVVRTIHAFCRSLLAAHPLEAGLHPELQVDPDGFRVEEIVREVVEDRLRAGYGEPGDPDLLALAGAGIGPAELVEAAVDALVRENLRPEDLEGSPFTPDRVASLRQGLAEAVRRLEGAAGGRLDGLARSKKTGETLEALRASARQAEEAGEAGDLEGFSHLCSALAETWDGTLRKRLKSWAAGDFNATESKALADGDPEAVASAAEGLLGRIDELRRLQPERLEQARRALAPMLAAARRQMRVTGLATFHDLLAEARDLLTRRPDVAGRVRRRIDQLLVDELQDTDRLQVDVITAIGLPERREPDGADDHRPGLFLVGDPKQSIYGWRNADLRAYEALWERVRAAGGEKVTLSQNFRSVPAILDEVARAVEPVMVEEPGVQPRFEPLVPCERLAGEPGFARGRWAPVEHWVSWTAEELAATRSGEATRLEAAAIARDLRDLHEQARRQGDEGFSWGKAALLLRSFSDLDDYLEALRREGVPFAVTGDRQYYRRREVIDAAALVRSVIDPGDHLALLTVLRSPAVGVPDAALIPLWQEGFPRAMTELGGPDREALGALEKVIERALERMPAPDTVPGLDRVAGWERVLLATVDALARLRRSFARDPADRLVERLRSLVPLELVASARHLGHYRLANLDRFFRRLIEDMESSAGDATAILRALRRGVSEALEEEEGRPAGAAETADAVQVMTIHKAKGLDFAHVYLGQLHKGSPRNGLPRVAAGEVRESAGGEGPRGGGNATRRVEYCLFGAPTPGFATIEEERRRVEAAERVRTLYVAMTRAEERLVLAGRWPETPRPRAPEAAESYLDLLGSRFPSELDLAEAWEGLRSGGGAEGGASEGTDRVDRHRVRWVFPGLATRREPDEAGGPERPGAETPPALPTPEAVEAESRRLLELRKEAASRQARPLGGPVSGESHRLMEEDLEDRRPGAAITEGGRGQAPPPQGARGATAGGGGGRGQAPPPQGVRGATAGEREAAMAAGTAVHRVLEELDLERLARDPAGALGTGRERLGEILRPIAAEERLETAMEVAETILDRFALGPLLERLAGVAPGVVARELPVLVRVDGGGRGAGGEEDGEEIDAEGAGSGALKRTLQRTLQRTPSFDSRPAEGPVAFLSGSVDLLYRDPETGLPVVADYKTDRVEAEEEVAERARLYAPQARAYARAIQEALGLPEPPRAELWFLWPGRIEGVGP